MRRAGGVTPIIIDDVFIGFVLEGDYCAEHEGGIEGISRVLSIPSGNQDMLGIERRRSHKPPESGDVTFKWETVSVRDYSTKKSMKHKVATLHVGNGSSGPRPETLAKRFGAWGYGNLFGAWDYNEFAIVSDDPIMHGHIETLARSIKEGDISAWSGRFDNIPFSPGGLALAITSRIPATRLDTMREADVDRKNLTDAAAKTGIAERLKNAGIRYYALSPRWANKTHRERTSHEVVFFLNPNNQKDNNFGWVTVEDLDMWIAGEGPIPKTPKASSHAP